MATSATAELQLLQLAAVIAPEDGGATPADPLEIVTITVGIGRAFGPTMAITIDAARTALPTAATFDAESVGARPAAKDLAAQGATAQGAAQAPTGPKDVTVAPPSSEVRAIQEQIAASKGDDVATHARRDVTNKEGGGIQIGVRARVATEGIVNVGQAGGTSTGR